MSPYTTPVYDRDASDVINRTQKGHFNVADWNRVYNNSLYVKHQVESQTGITISFTELTAPTIATIPTVADFNTLLTNINNIRAAMNLPVITGLLELKDDWIAGNTVSPTYLDANTWEQQLDLSLNYLLSLTDYIVYAGVASVGQPRFYQHRWRSHNRPRLPRTGVAVSGTGTTRQNKFRRYI